jgi:hypothetical protein
MKIVGLLHSLLKEFQEWISLPCPIRPRSIGFLERQVAPQAHEQQQSVDRPLAAASH